MKALSLLQPWASLIAVGAKRIETRNILTHYRGPLAIHAAQRFSMDQADLAYSEPFVTALRPHKWIQGPPRGCIVAVCELSDCWYTGRDEEWPAQWVVHLGEQERAFGDYSEERYGWLLRDIRALRKPIPARGAQGLWNWNGPANLEELLV